MSVWNDNEIRKPTAETAGADQPLLLRPPGEVIQVPEVEEERPPAEAASPPDENLAAAPVVPPPDRSADMGRSDEAIEPSTAGGDVLPDTDAAQTGKDWQVDKNLTRAASNFMRSPAMAAIFNQHGQLHSQVLEAVARVEEMIGAEELKSDPGRLKSYTDSSAVWRRFRGPEQPDPPEMESYLPAYPSEYFREKGLNDPGGLLQYHENGYVSAARYLAALSLRETWEVYNGPPESVPVNWLEFMLTSTERNLAMLKSKPVAAGEYDPLARASAAPWAPQPVDIFSDRFLFEFAKKGPLTDGNWPSQPYYLKSGVFYREKLDSLLTIKDKAGFVDELQNYNPSRYMAVFEEMGLNPGQITALRMATSQDAETVKFAEELYGQYGNPEMAVRLEDRDLWRQAALALADDPFFGRRYQETLKRLGPKQTALIFSQHISDLACLMAAQPVPESKRQLKEIWANYDSGPGGPVMRMPSLESQTAGAMLYSRYQQEKYHKIASGPILVQYAKGEAEPEQVEKGLLAATCGKGEGTWVNSATPGKFIFVDQIGFPVLVDGRIMSLDVDQAARLADSDNPLADLRDMLQDEPVVTAAGKDFGLQSETQRGKAVSLADEQLAFLDQNFEATGVKLSEEADALARRYHGETADILALAETFGPEDILQNLHDEHLADIPADLSFTGDWMFWSKHTPACSTATRAIAGRRSMPWFTAGNRVTALWRKLSPRARSRKVNWTA